MADIVGYMPLVGPHPGASNPAVSRRMSIARRKDTKPELDVRRLLHGRGMRYRVGYPVPGIARRSIDIAFTRAKVAVFLDGCFWHGCPVHGTEPRANADWWAVKLQTNAVRDAETTRALTDQGWTVLRFWEHEDAILTCERIQVAVSEVRATMDRSVRMPSRGPDLLEHTVEEAGHAAPA